MKKSRRIGVMAAVCLLWTTGGQAADFDGDNVADEFTITRKAETAAKQTGIRIANPWEAAVTPKAGPKGLGFVVRLSRTGQTYLLRDPEFLSTPMWLERKPLAEIIAKPDRRYAGWKKQVPSLQADAIQLDTEAGIDILLYWNGKRWRVFWPDEEP